MLLRQIIQDASGEFRDTRKNAHANVVTMKYVIMNRNKYISDFWKTVFYFALFAIQLHMGMVTMITCQRRLQLQKNKEIILHLTKKKRNMFKKKAGSWWVKQGRTSPYFLSFKILTLSNNNRTSPSVQIKFISGDSFNFTFIFEDIFYQMCLTNVFLCVFITFSTKINSNFSTHRQDNYKFYIFVWEHLKTIK